MNFQEPVQVETRLEAKAKQVLVAAQVLALFVVSGYVCLFLWNTATFLLCLRGIFRPIAYGPYSWLGGLWIGSGAALPYMMHERHPDQNICWSILVPGFFLLVLWLESWGLREHQRQVAEAQSEGNE